MVLKNRGQCCGIWKHRYRAALSGRGCLCSHHVLKSHQSPPGTFEIIVQLHDTLRGLEFIWLQLLIHASGKFNTSHYIEQTLSKCCVAPNFLLDVFPGPACTILDSLLALLHCRCMVDQILGSLLLPCYSSLKSRCSNQGLWSVVLWIRVFHNCFLPLLFGDLPGSIWRMDGSCITHALKPLENSLLWCQRIVNDGNKLRVVLVGTRRATRVCLVDPLQCGANPLGFLSRRRIHMGLQSRLSRYLGLWWLNSTV